MKSKRQSVWQDKKIFIGIDIHKKNWSVAGVYEGEQILHKSIPGQYSALESLLKPYRQGGAKISATYEACGFGYRLYDQLQGAGIEASVTAPSKILRATADRVKTDKRDSKKLAEHYHLGILKMVPVPGQQERIDRDLLRARRQLVAQSTRLKLQIKSRLQFFGHVDKVQKWSKAGKSKLREVGAQDPELAMIGPWIEMLELYENQIKELDRKIVELSGSDRYKRNFEILVSIPGVGVITAMTVLTELSQFRAFRSGMRLASYVGLVPSEHSSGQVSRQGGITKTGNKWVRSALIESSWVLIKQDGVMQTHYRKIYVKNAKKNYAKQIAITAVARKLLLRMHAMVRMQQPYVIGLVE